MKCIEEREWLKDIDLIFITLRVRLLSLHQYLPVHLNQTIEYSSY